MRRLLVSLSLTLLLAAVPGVARAQDDDMREAIDALVELISTGGDAALTRYADERLAPAYRDRIGREAAIDARQDLEEKLERSKAAYRAGVAAARETVTAGAEDAEE